MARARVDAARREEILEAFEACVVRQGIERTTLEDIAREAGQPRSFVRYFAGNRDELVAKLVDRLLARTSARVAKMRERSNGDTAMLVRLYFEEFFSDEHSNRIVIELWRMTNYSDDVARRVFGLYDEILHDLATDLSKGGDGDAQAIFDGAYASFSLGLGMSILRSIGVSPVRPAGLTELAHRLALGQQPMPATREVQQKKEA
ncbi:TetR/AcrR family transcriptional regulator [Sphingobium sp. B2]|uniref:TetR/AcrR family transcriptional regulator n=1 Tax=Sphingobium sp. B2 TaxID=2583228 RepID=UPI00119F6C97|nr:TetR/AcrR family transcriptional regulator [Sphingobium sp. B2]